MSPIKYGIIAATLVTAVIHVFLGETLFLLNGLGYLALLAHFMLPRFARWREPARWMLSGYAAVTIALYFVVHADGSWQEDGLGLLTKMVELILILLLVFDRLQEQDRTNVGERSGQ